MGIALLQVTCSPNYYGLPGDLCLPCPVGGACAGYVDLAFTLPTPQAGWYNLNGSFQEGTIGNQTLFQLCPDSRGLVDRHDLTCIVPCDPPEACIGNNLCSEAYRDAAPLFRCGLCAEGFYRVSGGCVKCPSQAWLLIVLFILLAVVVCAGGWLLNRRSVNTAFLSIGVDYFQVLAMFANAKVQVSGDAGSLLLLLLLLLCQACGLANVRVAVAVIVAYVAVADVHR